MGVSRGVDERLLWDGEGGRCARPGWAGDDGYSGVNWSYHVATSKRRVARVTVSGDTRRGGGVVVVNFIYEATDDQPTWRVTTD